MEIRALDQLFLGCFGIYGILMLAGFIYFTGLKETVVDEIKEYAKERANYQVEVRVKEAVDKAIKDVSLEKIKKDITRKTIDATKGLKRLKLIQGDFDGKYSKD